MKYISRGDNDSMLRPIEPKDCVQLEVINGDEVFKITNVDGKIQIRVDGKLWIEPLSCNSIQIEVGKK